MCESFPHILNCSIILIPPILGAKTSGDGLSAETAWLVLTIALTAGAVGSLTRWLLNKTSARAILDPRVYLILGLVLLALAVICGTIALIP